MAEADLGCSMSHEGGLQENKGMGEVGRTGLSACL